MIQFATSLLFPQMLSEISKSSQNFCKNDKIERASNDTFKYRTTKIMD